MGNRHSEYQNIDTKPVEVQLLYAAEYGDTERLERLLNSFYLKPNANLDIDAAKYSLWTPLFMAAKQGNSECIASLLNAGALVDGVNQDQSWTPLWVATYAGHDECVSLLVKAGANLEAKYPETPVFIAAREGRNTSLKILVDAGGSVDVKNKLEQSPLHVAAMENNVECVRLLVEAGANIESKDISGSTPLLCASEHASAECLVVLLKHGADHTVSAIGGRMSGLPPMHICASKSKISCLKLLWKFGASPFLPSSKGILASSLAVTAECRDFLYQVEGTIRTLKDIARLCIRKCISNEKLPLLKDELFLPPCVMKYLSYDD